MKLFTTIDNRDLALDLIRIEGVLVKEKGIQLITSSDTYMVRGDFIEIVDAVERAKEGKS